MPTANYLPDVLETAEPERLATGFMANFQDPCRGRSALLDEVAEQSGEDLLVCDDALRNVGGDPQVYGVTSRNTGQQLVDVDRFA